MEVHIYSLHRTFLRFTKQLAEPVGHVNSEFNRAMTLVAEEASL